MVHCAHLLPSNTAGKQWELLPPVAPSQLDVNFLRLVNSLEEEFARAQGVRELGDTRDRAILMSVVTSDRLGADASDIDFLPFGELEQSVRDDVNLIRNSPLIPSDVNVHGFIYDVKSGKLNEVD